MKKLFSLIIITLALPCIAMDQEPKPKPIVLRKINGVKNPCCGHFLPTGKVIISDGDGCSIYDIQTNTELRRIRDVPFQHIAVHPNGKLCALSGTNGLKIYDVKTDLLQYLTKQSYNCIASVFEPLSENLISLCPDDNYAMSFTTNAMAGCYFRYGRHFGVGMTPIIAPHPAQQIMAVVQNEHCVKFFEEDPQTGYCTLLKNNLPIKIDPLDDMDGYEFCRFNQDGSLLVYGNDDSCYVANKDGIIFKLLFRITLHDVIFHSNGKILITLSQPNNELSFWNIPDIYQKDPQPIFTMSCSSSYDNPPTEHRHMHSYLSCNRSGKDVLVVLSKECLVVPVPFEAIYKGTKDEYILSYLVLQKYLPKDVSRMFIAKLLKARKRKLENNTKI